MRAGVRATETGGGENRPAVRLAMPGLCGAPSADDAAPPPPSAAAVAVAAAGAAADGASAAVGAAAGNDEDGAEDEASPLKKCASANTPMSPISFPPRCSSRRAPARRRRPARHRNHHRHRHHWHHRRASTTCSRKDGTAGERSAACCPPRASSLRDLKSSRRSSVRWGARFARNERAPVRARRAPLPSLVARTMRVRRERAAERARAGGADRARRERERAEARGAREHGAERHRPRGAEAGIAPEPQRRERAAGRRHGVPSERARALGAEVVVRPEV